MAKEVKKETAGKKSAKYGVDYLAKKLGIEAASVRVALRNKGVKKNDEGVYDWGSAKAADEVAAKLRAPKKTEAKKPAKKAAAKKAA
jgi:hypothetical protein